MGERYTRGRYFFFRPATPPANLPSPPKLPRGLCPGACPAGAGSGRPTGAAGPGSLGFFGGTSGGPFSFSTGLMPTPTSSPRLANLAFFRARSCVFLNLSSNSTHLTPPSSLALSRFGRSKDAEVPRVLGGALGGPVSELFCLKWLKLEVGTYPRGAMWR
jgi:hypothetical protein